jgi:hypothetical protein
VFFLLRNGSAEQNSEHFYFSQNGSEQNYKVLRGFLFYEMVRHGIPSFFIFGGMTRTEFLAFSVSRNRRNSFRLFRLSRNDFSLGKWQPLDATQVFKKFK